jgi:hypothetical protein
VSPSLAPVRGVLAGVGWLLAAGAIAFGAAGVVAGIGGPAGSPDHPELTWSMDRAIQPGFDRALTDLESLSDQVDRLGVLGRGSLAALAARNQAQLGRTITEGSTLVAAIDTNATAIRGRLRALPGVDHHAPPLPPAAAITLGADVQARYTALDEALGTTASLSDAWVRLTSGSLAAIRLATVLTQHDASTAVAAREGRGGHYGAALKQLDTSKSLVADASKQRDTLQNTVDVSTLSRWLELNAAYDASLRKLYDALSRSKGRVNAEVKAAFDAEAKAHEQLPPDTRGLVVIMGEIARGGLNQAVIEIEEARGQLAAAIAALQGTPVASPEPSSSPDSGASGAPSDAGPGVSASPVGTPRPSASATPSFPAIVTAPPSG